MRTEQLHYDRVECWIRESVAAGADFLFDPLQFHKELWRVSEEYGVPYESLYSFFRNVHVHHVKKTTPCVRAKMKKSVREYSEHGRSIVDMARSANFPPHLFARYVVEAVTKIVKKKIGEAMRDPTILDSPDVVADEFLASERWIRSPPPPPPDSSGEASSTSLPPPKTTRIATEVREAQQSDPMYGPMHDKKSHIVGIEYEVVLEHYLNEMGVPFETEADLRDRGTSRTPDILLRSPLGVNVPKKDGEGTEWKVINWIDSKAMFGDVGTHGAQVVPQAESYIHRFGPGLLIYWFGHAPLGRLDDAQGDIVIASWDVPDQFMLPTGEILRRRN